MSRSTLFSYEEKKLHLFLISKIKIRELNSIVTGLCLFRKFLYQVDESFVSVYGEKMRETLCKGSRVLESIMNST